jgi:hypothetical protein
MLGLCIATGKCPEEESRSELPEEFKFLELRKYRMLSFMLSCAGTDTSELLASKASRLYRLKSILSVNIPTRNKPPSVYMDSKHESLNCIQKFEYMMLAMYDVTI